MTRLYFRPLALLLSWRYLRTNDVALRFVTRTSALGLIISITTLLVVQGIVAGFQRDLDSNILGFVPHITLSKPTGFDVALVDRVANANATVTASMNAVQSTGLVSTRNGIARSQFIGVNPNDIKSFITGGNLDDDALWETLTPTDFSIVLGSGVARELRAEVGDAVLVSLTTTGVSPFGYMPRQKRFTVSGIAETQTSLDSLIAYVNLEDARRLLQLDADVNAAFIRLRDPLAVADSFFDIALAANEPGLLASTWQDLFGALFNFLQRFKNLLFLLLSMLVAVAAFNLVSNMVMLVHSRRADVAVLRTLGSDTTSILTSLFTTALTITCASLVVCIGLAWLVALALPTLHEWLSQLIGVSLRDGFALHQLSVVLLPGDMLRVAVATLLMVSLGALYPAWRATRLGPAEILRDE